MPASPAPLGAVCATGATVVTAGFAPVKGTRHQAHEAVLLDAAGPVGDRAYGLVDPEQRRVLRTVQHPTLLSVGTGVDPGTGELSLSLPDGTWLSAPAEATGESITCDYWGREVALQVTAGPHAEAFSDLLGRRVRLAAAPRGGIVFAGAVSIVTTASLADLCARAALGGASPRLVDAARFRATLVLDAGGGAYAEEGWLGRELRIGEAVLRIGVGIPRCAVVDLDPASGVKDARLLKELAAYRPRNTAGEPVFGVYAEVVRPGTVRPGDPVRG